MSRSPTLALPSNMPYVATCAQHETINRPQDKNDANEHCKQDRVSLMFTHSHSHCTGTGMFQT